MRRILLGLSLSLSALLVALGATFAYAQTGPGKSRIVQIVETALSDEAREVRAEELTGFLPFNFEIGRVRMADDEGVWLEVDRAHARLAPDALLRGEVRLSEAGAARVALHRLPEGEPREPRPPEPRAPVALPELPEVLPIVAVDRLAIERIELGEPLLGEAAVLNLEGRLAVEDQGRAAVAALDLVRIDQPTAHARLDARLGLVEPHLSLLLDAEETGGLAARLAGQPEMGDVRLRLEGDAPLADWRGALLAEAEGLMRLDADLALALTAVPTFGLDATLTPGPLALPEDLRDVVGEEVTLALAMHQPTAQALFLDRLELRTALAVLTGDGGLDLERQELAARLELRIDDLSPLEGLAQTPLAGAVQLDASAIGAIAEPQVHLRLAASGLRAAELLVASLASEIDLAVLEAPGGLRVVGSGHAEGLELLEGPALPEDTLTFDLAAILPVEGLIEVERLAVHGATIALDAAGSLDRERMLGEGRLALTVDELAVLAAALAPDMDLAGAARLDADFRLDEAGQLVRGRVDGGLERLEGLPPGAMALLGPQPTLSADLAFRPDQELRVSAIRLDGAALRLAGDAGIALPGQALSGDLSLELPDLAVLEAAAARPIAGRARLDARIGGTLGAPELRLDLDGRDLVVDERTFEQATARLTASGPPDALSGELELAVDHLGERLALGAPFRLEERRIAVPSLRLSAPGTLVEGTVRADLDSMLVEGNLRGRIDDLALLRPWHGQELAGRMTLDAVLDTPGGRQDARLSLRAFDILGDFGEIEAVELDASVVDALGEAVIRADGLVSDFVNADLHVQRMALSADGPIAALGLSAEIEGRQLDQDFDLSARAELGLLEDVQRLRLDRLEGRYAGERLELVSPATIELDGPTLRLDQLDLRIGRAELRSRLELEQERVLAEAELSGFPLAMVESFGGPELEGRIDARARLGGTRAAPVASLELTGSDIAGSDPAFATVPPATVQAQARLEGGRLEGLITVDRLVERRLEATFALPVVLALDPYRLELPPEGAVRARLDAEASLERLALLAGLDDQRLQGIATAALAVDGTVAEPRVQGTLAVDGGGWEHGEFGTVLREVTLRARGTERRLVIEELRATDGAQGRIAGEGELSLAADEGFPFDVRVRLDRANLVRRADVDATVSGDVRLYGDLADALLEGRLTVDPAEIELADLEDRPRVVVIEVEEVGDGPRIARERPAEPMALRLDLTVDLPARIFVRGRGLDSEWRGNLRATGPANQPVIVGNLTVVRGNFDFLDRRFALREGTVDLDGAVPPVPYITVDAVTETRELTAIVRIEGRPDELTLVLDSDPSLPQDEVVAHVLFDRGLNRITPGQAVRLASTLAQLTGAASGGLDVVGRLRQAVGLDVLEVDPFETGTLRAGAYLGEDVYVELERGLTTGTGRATVEIEVLPRVNVQTEVTERGDSGIGIKWRYDY